MTPLDAGGTGATPTAPGLAAGRLGFFGKLPGRGDFVRRDLPNAFVDSWDEWLQQGMAASRATLGEGWLDAWLCAPIWRLALSNGICGPDAWAGVMMPSVDRAGRYFPLTLVAMAPAGVPASAMLAGDWIVAVERVALSALGEDTDFDNFAQAVANLPAFPALRPESWAGGWRARGAAGDPSALTLALAAASASAASGAHCVFATSGGGRVAPAAWVLPQLPPHRAFIGLIDDLQSTGTTQAPIAVPIGMAVPLAIGGVAAVAALPLADTELGHAASLFGSDFATDAPPSLEGEPPGGAFDHLFDELAPNRGATVAGAFDTLPESGAPSPAAFDTLPEAAAPSPAAPAETATIEVRPAGPTAAAAVDPWPAPEGGAPLLPKDLFGDVPDDVPAVPDGLFDDKDGKGPPS